MLVLTRHKGEGFLMRDMDNGRTVRVVVNDLPKGRTTVSLAIEAPEEVKVLREELVISEDSWEKHRVE